VLKLYDLVKAFKIHVSEKNMAFCATIARHYAACSALVSQRASQRPDLMQMFRGRLAKESTSLMMALKEIHNDIFQPSLLSTTTDIATAKSRLAELDVRLEELRQRKLWDG